MKIRSDYVTNSSSSSFIIAVNKNCTENDIKNILLNHKDSLKYFVQEDIEYTEYSDEFEELDSLDEKIELAIKYLSEELVNMGDMSIDNWDVTATEGSNESEDFLSIFLYQRCPTINTDKIKIKSCW